MGLVYSFNESKCQSKINSEDTGRFPLKTPPRIKGQMSVVVKITNPKISIRDIFCWS